MFKLPDHLHSDSHHTSFNNKYTSEFETEDINVWTKYNEYLFFLNKIK